jgi:hypothetical protein
MRCNPIRTILPILTCAILLTFAAGAQAAYPTGAQVDIFSPYSQELYFNAQGCSIDTHVVLFPSNLECGFSANESWIFEELKDGYDVVYANYGSGGDECLNVAGGNYALRTYVLAWQCNPKSPTPNEEWRKPERTPDPIGNDWIVPGRQPNTNEFCANAQGGLHERANIVLWYCNEEHNESWWFG